MMRRLPLVLVVLGVGACSLLVDLDALEGVDLDDAGGFRADGTASGPHADAPTTPDAALGVDGGSDAAPDAGPGCSGKGPTGVQIGAFCIDSTEVTGHHYLEFLAAMAQSPLDQVPECAWNTSYAPALGVADNAEPVFGADWCDARAYCAFAGKRLCGALGGGGPVPSGVRNNAFSDEWFKACTHDGQQAFPYGNTYDPEACNGHARDGGSGPVPVGSLRTCEGGYAGVFDLSGNLWEWEDGCTDGGPDGTCVVRGGSYAAVNQGACNTTSSVRRDRGSANDITIRCCSDAVGP